MFEYRDRCVQTAHNVHLYTPGYKDTAYTCTHLDTRQDGFHRFTHTYLCTLQLYSNDNSNDNDIHDDNDDKDSVG